MRKIIIILFAVFSLPLFVNAKEIPDFFETYNLQPSCFKKKATLVLNEGHSDSVKVKIKQDRGVVFYSFRANDLSWKIFDYGSEENIDYEILAYSESEKEAEKMEYIKDGNIKTGFNFDPYNRETKELFIDAKRILIAGTFIFKLNFVSDLRPVFFVSKENDSNRPNNFIRVNNVENYDWRYLKIVFEKQNKDEISDNLLVQDLSLLERGAITYLLKPKYGIDKVFVYADYRCADTENLQKALNGNNKYSKSEVFAINAMTDSYEVFLEDNVNFNNDQDNDSVSNEDDNCQFVKNKDQIDSDGDFLGDVCDFDNERKNFNEIDSDGDGVGDYLDNCVYIVNSAQIDSNADGIGDVCVDDDKDGIIGFRDNCINVSNINQEDVNNNGIGDACEFDKDNDEVFDSIDNCVNVINYDQKDVDFDNIGDVCDNCNLYNPQQLDRDNNGFGDVCDSDKKYLKNKDKDNDGMLDIVDNCPDVVNLNQDDADGDGVGDFCDNCQGLKNNQQEDKNNNKIGDFCEDVDNDGINGYLDNCPYNQNVGQDDRNNDGVGDVCDDGDADGFVEVNDNCPFDYNFDQNDIDDDGLGDVCDQKDDRFIESNKKFFIGLILFLSLVFLILIFTMVKKMNLLMIDNEGVEKDNEGLIKK
jgi:hypothetical protein